MPVSHLHKKIGMCLRLVYDSVAYLLFIQNWSGEPVGLAAPSPYNKSLNCVVNHYC